MFATQVLLMPAFGHIKFDRILITFGGLAGPFVDAKGAPRPTQAEVLSPPGKGAEWAKRVFPHLVCEVFEVAIADDHLL